MKIVVIGGSGLIGSKLVNILRNGGHEVVAASPDSGVNTITGEGLSEALAGAEVVVDVANSPSFEDRAVLKFFETSTRNLLAAETSAGVKHQVVLSIVGTDRLPDSGYFRAKLAQENLVKNSGIPYTIVHSTQFFEFLGGIANSATDGEYVFLSPAFVQPISADDVATAMARVVVGPAVNGTVEIAGPERFRLSEIVQQYLIANADPRKVSADIHARYFGAELDDNSLVPAEDARLGEMTFAVWMANHKAPLRAVGK
jgi:uncharacterized protein YbjT (DUF2867 family)